MNIQKNLDKLETFQENILEYLNDETNYDEKLQNLVNLFETHEIFNNKHDFKLILRMLSAIINNYHRTSSFFNKIDQLLLHIKDDIKKNFLNFEIFNIFKRNKRILLFLFKEKILIFDKYIVNKLCADKCLSRRYPQFFTPEIKKLAGEVWFKDHFNDYLLKEYPEDFDEKRQNGENDSFICKLIRNDSIDEFIVYINQSNINLNTSISESIYETNTFFYNSKIGYGKVLLIEYAAFCGSIQIFNYLRLNGVELTPSLWLYAIHGQNSEIIHLIESCVKPEDNSFENCLIESIKCHHNQIAEYIQNYCTVSTTKYGLKYYNFNFIQLSDLDKKSFFNLCKYDYYLLANDFMTNKEIDVNYNINREMKDHYKSPIYIAIEKENIDIIKLLLSNENIDANIQHISGYNYSNGLFPIVREKALHKPFNFE